MKRLSILFAVLLFPLGAHATCSTLSTTSPYQFPIIWGYNPSLGNGTQTYAPVAENSDCTIGGSGGGGGGGTVATSPVTFQSVAPVTATALPNNAYGSGFVVTALPSNTGNVCLGGPGVTTSTGYCIAAGQSAPGYVSNNSDLVYIIGNGTDGVEGSGN